MDNLFQNVKPKSKELYISNIKRLNGGKDVDINNLDFLEDVDGTLEKLTSKYAPTTIRSYFISICSLLNELPKYKSLYDKYYKILISQNKSLEKNNTKSETQKENWISQDEVLQTQIRVQDKALALMEDKTKYKPREWSTVLDWVILSLYTLLPPRRIIDYTEMNVVNDTSLEADEKMNYWVKSKEKFIFTNYKTSGTYQTQIVKIPEPLQYVLDKYMEVRSDRDKNNIPLLTDNKGEAIRENYMITKALNRIFDKKVSVNMLRNIYLTSNFKDNLANLQSTATAMGTSPETIQSHYIKLDEDIPDTTPKDKKIKINRITKLEEHTPSTEPKDKGIKIKRVEKPVFPEVKQIVVTEEVSEEEENSTNTEDSEEEENSTNTEDSDDEEEIVKPKNGYPKKVIEAVRKIYDEINKLVDTKPKNSAKKIEKLYAQLDKIEDAFEITSYFDNDEEPPSDEDEMLNEDEKETYHILTEKDKVQYDWISNMKDKKAFLQKTQKKYDNAKKAKERKQIKDEAEAKKASAKQKELEKVQAKEKKETIAKLKAKWKEMTATEKKAWKTGKIQEWKARFPHDTNVPNFTYWGEISK